MDKMKPKIRAFTGPSKLSPEEIAALKSSLRTELEFDADTYRTGAAYGLDTIAAQVCMKAAPKAHHSIFVPDAPHNVLAVRRLEAKGAKILRCASFETPARAYRERNERMLDGATELVAVLRSETFYRSGEWMTVRIAERRGIPVVTFIIEEE